MHVEKRKRGKKLQYFLAHSYREGSQVHKLRKYLGQDLTANLLEQRKKIAQKLMLEEIHRYKMIQDPLRVVLSTQDIAAIKKLEVQIPLAIYHLSERQWKEFSKIFTYNTNAIEAAR